MKTSYAAMRGLALLAIASGALACLACEPGVFSRAARGVTGADAGSPDAGAQARDARTPAPAGREQSGAAAIGGMRSGTRASAGAGGQTGSAAGHAGTSAAGASGSGGHAGTGGCAVRPALDAVKLTPVELGVVSVPAELDEVATGPAVLVQDRVLWMLGTREQSPFQGRPIVVSVSPGNLQKRSPQLDVQTTAQLLFPEEAADAPSRVTPTSAWLAADGGSVQFYFTRTYIFNPLGVGLAQSTPEAPTANTLVDSDSLFPRATLPDGGVGDRFRPLTMSAATQRAGVSYVYMCHAKPDVSEETNAAGEHYQPCRVGRVPAQQVRDGSRYQFWDGAQWQGDFTRASVVIDHVESGLSVEYNAYLDKYLAVHSGSDDTLVLKWATAPQGPFQTLARIDTTKGTGTGLLTISFGGREIVGLRQDCDRTLFIPYTVPLQDAAAPQVLHLETHVMQVDLE